MKEKAPAISSQKRGNANWVSGFCLALAGCGFLNSPCLGAEGDRVDFFSDSGFGNAVAVVQHPAGVHHEGVTYVTYQGPLEDPYVASYDHETDEWSGPFKAGVSDMGKDPERGKIDNHGKPSMIIDQAGYVHLVFGGHGGMPIHGENLLGNTHYGRMQHVVSKDPLDISSWEVLDNVSPFGTYSQWVRTDQGELYLFYRHGAHRSDWVYQKSTDNGRSFDPPVSILKHRRRTDLEAEDSWYAWFGKGKGDAINAVFDYHLCWDADAGRDGRGHTTERHNLFYMEMDTSTGAWRNVEGDALVLPIEREQAEDMALVADTGDLWTFLGSTSLDAEGNPHIMANVGADLGLKTGGPKRPTHFRWTDQEWIGDLSSGLPVARGDLLVASPNEVSLLLAYRDDQGDGEVSWWHSTDGGKSFQRGDVLLRRKRTGFAISSLIRDSHPDARALVAGIESGTDLRKMYLVGDRGPIQRSEREAKQITP